MNMRSIKRCHPATCRTAARFLGEERGSITVFGIVGFVMCIAVIGLAFDVGRVMGIHTEVSSFADRAALSAAQQLNGQPGAVRSAVREALAIGDGKRMTLTGGEDVTIARIEFREEQDDQDTMITWVAGRRNGGFGNGDPDDSEMQRARFATVFTSEAREGFLFLPVTGSSTRSATVSRTAMAGFQREACNIAPIMVCNPDEDRRGDGYEDMDVPGNGETFRLHGRYGQDRDDRQEWEPGAYSLLRTDDDTSASDLRRLVSRADPGTACFGRMVRVERNLNSPRNNGNGNNGNNNDNDNTRIQIGRGFEDRYDQNRRQFPVAVINCREFENRLDSGRSVPVETYGLMTITRENEDSDLWERGYIRLRRSGEPSVTDGHIHEYPVLVE